MPRLGLRARLRRHRHARLELGEPRLPRELRLHSVPPRLAIDVKLLPRRARRPSTAARHAAARPGGGGRRRNEQHRRDAHLVELVRETHLVRTRAGAGMGLGFGFACARGAPTCARCPPLRWRTDEWVFGLRGLCLPISSNVVGGVVASMRGWRLWWLRCEAILAQESPSHTFSNAVALLKPRMRCLRDIRLEVQSCRATVPWHVLPCIAA